MFDTVRDQLAAELAAVRDAGMEKHEAILETRQGARITLQDGSELINLCANNYLGLAGDPAMADAAHAALDEWGFGLASVRFICGTQEIHRRLEGRIAAFLGTEDAILFGSCFDANTGLFEVLLTADDAVIMVDDSHAVGILGPGGRGTPESTGAGDRIDILTGTLGKAIGGASGGYVAGRREVVELLRQRSRPYLFSNTVAPPVVAASVRALELIETSAELRDRLRENTTHFRGL